MNLDKIYFHYKMLKVNKEKLMENNLDSSYRKLVFVQATLRNLKGLNCACNSLDECGM